MVELSVIVPLYDERDNVEPLLDEITTALAPLGRSFEILAVDDASRDGTADAVAALAARRPAVRLIRHARNHGQSAALATGLATARGEIVATLDGDGQNDPADIPKLLAALGPGVAAVCGIRRQRRDRWSKRLASRIANAVRRALTGDRIEDAGCGLRVMRRSALRELPVFNGVHRFLPILLGYQGLRVEQRPVTHRPRRHGRSKYGIADRLWRGWRDCLAMRWYRARCFPLDRVHDRARP